VSASPPLACRLLNAPEPTSPDGDRLLHIPGHWTAEEALVVCNFLEAAINAIWDRHGPEMAGILAHLSALQQAQEARHAADADADADLGPDLDPDPEDDIPF
jgi:hypothetical protein